MDPSMRIATISDAGLLLTWRNDPNVRKFSKSTSLISPTEHNVWLEDRLKRFEEEPLFIFTIEGDLAGTARLDALPEEEKSFEISILIDPKFQGLGYSKILLNQVFDHAFGKLQAEMIIAVIHSGNSKSIKLFQSAGFIYSGQEGDFFKYLKPGIG
jgi:RimJ/RimL family protein N-acetyltransferase